MQQSDDRAWVEPLFEAVRQDYGFDLRATLEASPMGELAKLIKQATHSKPQAICMPAFMALDKTTTMGPLWVVGTPLFDNYYARWSWPKGDTHPAFFLEALKDAQSCKEADASPKKPAVLTGKAGSPTLVRSELGRASSSVSGGGAAQQYEGQHAQEDDDEEIPQPREMSLQEIRFPHWAQELPEL